MITNVIFHTLFNVYKTRSSFPSDTPKTSLAFQKVFPFCSLLYSIVIAQAGRVPAAIPQSSQRTSPFRFFPLSYQPPSPRLPPIVGSRAGGGLPPRPRARARSCMHHFRPPAAP